MDSNAALFPFWDIDIINWNVNKLYLIQIICTE